MPRRISLSSGLSCSGFPALSTTFSCLPSAHASRMSSHSPQHQRVKSPRSRDRERSAILRHIANKDCADMRRSRLVTLPPFADCRLPESPGLDDSAHPRHGSNKGASLHLAGDHCRQPSHLYAVVREKVAAFRSPANIDAGFHFTIPKIPINHTQARKQEVKKCKKCKKFWITSQTWRKHITPTQFVCTAYGNLQVLSCLPSKRIRSPLSCLKTPSC